MKKDPTRCLVQPFKADPRDVRPYAGPLRMGAKELPLFDSVAAELVRRAGTVIEYFGIDTDGSDYDPLYAEPTTRRFKGPFRLEGWVGYSNSTPDTRQEGFVNSWATSAWIARTEFERVSFPFQPGEGDIIRMWKLPFFDLAGTDVPIPGGGYYFNVVNVSEDGHLFDQAQFVGFTFSISRNTEFTPERRIEGLT